MPDRPPRHGDEPPDDDGSDGGELADDRSDAPGEGQPDRGDDEDGPGDGARQRLADAGREELARETSLTPEQVAARIDEWAPSGVLRRPTGYMYLNGRLLEVREARDESLANRMETARETARRSPEEALEMTRRGPWWEDAAASCGTAVGFAEVGIDDNRLEEAIRNFGQARATAPEEVISAVLERQESPETGTASISDQERLRLLRLVGDSEDSVAKMYRELDSYRTDAWTEDMATRASEGMRRSFAEEGYGSEEDPAVVLGAAAGCAERGYRRHAFEAVDLFRDMQAEMLRVLTIGILPARPPGVE